MLANWPSFDPHNFSQHRPSDPSNPSKMTPITYHPTHERTFAPPDQVITSESRNVLLRNFYKRTEDKVRSFLLGEVIDFWATFQSVFYGLVSTPWDDCYGERSENPRMELEGK
ncbi:hypothetical protein M9H77_32597 [Catharanthus roseus]|uniref:Uncharacterized protein n=1 Tax=Catharanthus roseus TaxID=4058 RepID=A0ACC0A4U3_CATRO|nr:hypothetical protein M9H77_32597 [Catharanthus roseus]